MDQERIDLDALFDQQEPNQPVPQKPNKKPLFIILASVLVLAVLAVGGYLYQQFTDTSDPIRVTMYKAPLTGNTFYDYTPTDQELMDHIWIHQITDGYRCYYTKDVAFEESYSVQDSNFWFFIEPNSWAVKEDWTVETQIEKICSHDGQKLPAMGYYKLLNEKLEFDGWLVCGSLPHSADLKIQLRNSSGEEVTSQTVHVDPYISPICEHLFGASDQTLQFLDYVVHLPELAQVMELPENEQLPAYMELSKEHPVLFSLLCRMDLLQTIDNYALTCEADCAAYALKLKPLFDAYLNSDEYWIGRRIGREIFISIEEAAAMDTQSLADYLVHNVNLRDYIISNIASLIYYEDNANGSSVFSVLSAICHPVQELANRDDAASVLLPLVPESLVAKNLITLPEIQRNIKLDEIQSYLMAVYPGEVITMNQNVVKLLTNMDDMSYLAMSGTLEETLQDMPLFQRASLEPTTNTFAHFFRHLRRSSATDTQKVVATAFLSMPAYQQLMNKTQKKLFEESKVNLTP